MIKPSPSRHKKFKAKTSKNKKAFLVKRTKSTAEQVKTYLDKKIKAKKFLNRKKLRLLNSTRNQISDLSQRKGDKDTKRAEQERLRLLLLKSRLEKLFFRFRLSKKVRRRKVYKQAEPFTHSKTSCLHSKKQLPKRTINRWVKQGVTSLLNRLITKRVNLILINRSIVRSRAVKRLDHLYGQLNTALKCIATTENAIAALSQGSQVMFGGNESIRARSQHTRRLFDLRSLICQISLRTQKRIKARDNEAEPSPIAFITRTLLKEEQRPSATSYYDSSAKKDNISCEGDIKVVLSKTTSFAVSPARISTMANTYSQLTRRNVSALIHHSGTVSEIGFINLVARRNRLMRRRTRRKAKRRWRFFKKVQCERRKFRRFYKRILMRARWLNTLSK